MPKKELWKQFPDFKVFLIDPNEMAKEFPVWEKYIGCHHYGIQCEHIPENEIWISKKASKEVAAILDHEIIEREVMKDLEENKGFTSKQAYEIGHYLANGVERYKESYGTEFNKLVTVFEKINEEFPTISRKDAEQWLAAIAGRGYNLNEGLKHQLLCLIEE